MARELEKLFGMGEPSQHIDQAHIMLQREYAERCMQRKKAALWAAFCEKLIL